MEEINIKELFAFFIKRIWVVLLCCVLIIIIGCIYCKNKQNVYFTASAKLFIPVNEEINTSKDVIPSLAEVFSFCREAAKSKNILSKVANDLDLNIDVNKLSNNVSVITEDASFSVEVKVKDNNSENSQNIANRVASYLIEEVKNNYSNRNIIMLDEANSTNEIHVVNVSKILTFCFVVGIVVGFGIVFVMFYFDDKIRTIDNLENKFSIPVVGYINDFKKGGKIYDK